MQTILVFAALAHDASMSVRLLRAAGLEAYACHDAATLGDEIRRGLGTVLIVEELLNGEVLRVIEQALEEQAAWSDLPLLVMASHGADSLAARRAVERLGNVTLLERPVRINTLVSAARSALRGRARQFEVRLLSARKDQFLAMLAHELRNPLAPIRSAATVLNRLQVDPSVGRMAAIVERQVSHLTRLVDDLLDVARIANGKLELKVGGTTARQVAAQAVEIADTLLQQRSHRLALDLPDEAEDVALRGDHVRLVQTVANLLVNAAKFTPEGGDISLAVRSGEEAVDFVVTDTGRGLEAQDLARIFESFEQARDPGEPSNGLGLGLHLAKAFAELHGGTITAASAGRGSGSQFTLRLPPASA